jgi:hypothetical protein
MWPMIWPAPDDPTLTLAVGESFLELPVRPPQASDGALAPFAAPEAAPAPPITAVVAPSRHRALARDVATGEIAMTYRRDWGASRHEDLGLVTSGSGLETYTIVEGDPLSAR